MKDLGFRFFPSMDQAKVTLFDEAARAYRFSKIKTRPDDLFVELGYIEWITKTMKNLSIHIDKWRLLAKHVQEVFRLCAGLGLFAETSNSLKKCGEDALAQELAEDHASTAFAAYIRCLDQYRGRYTGKHGIPTPFSWYMAKTILQKVGTIIYRIIPWDLGVKRRLYYIDEYNLSSGPAYFPLSRSKMAELAGTTKKAVKLRLAKGRNLREVLLERNFIVGKT